MNEFPLAARTIAETLAVCKLDSHDDLPSWVPAHGFVSVTRTVEELSIVCQASVIPAGIAYEGDWRAIEIVGPLDFALTGILARILQPLAEAGISVFAISTYNTDYVMVKADRLEEAKQELKGICNFA